MISEVEDALLTARGAVVRKLSERRLGLLTKRQILAHYIKELFPGLLDGPKVSEELDKLDNEIKKLLLVENIVCYEINRLRRQAERIVKDNA